MPNDSGHPPRRDAAILAHVAAEPWPVGFANFWGEWRRQAFETTPAFIDDRSAQHPSRCGAEGVTHVLRSYDGTRLGTRFVHMAPGEPRAVVVRLHGYRVQPQEPLTDELRYGESLNGASALIIKLRLRGYPGSEADTGPIAPEDEQGQPFSTRGLPDPQRWSVAQTVGDVVAAVRAARSRFPSAALMLHGESFGGGLAVIAASALEGRVGLSRLVLGLPTLGDWSHRLRSEPGRGLGSEVAAWVRSHPEHAEEAVRTLRLFDATVHAAHITCPVLCKLALEDPVVPAQTASAIFNALGTDPGLKWRYITQTGHEADQLATARRHAEFERLAGRFLDPRRRPGEIMRDEEGRLWPPGRHP